MKANIFNLKYENFFFSFVNDFFSFVGVNGQWHDMEMIFDRIETNFDCIGGKPRPYAIRKCANVYPSGNSRGAVVKKGTKRASANQKS